MRELWFAYVRGGPVRSIDATADTVLTAGRDAGNALNAAVSAVLAEELDDGPVRATRDRTTVELRVGTTNIIRRFRSIISLKATDPSTGKVIDQGLIDAAESLADTYLPAGNLGGLAEEGPALQFQAGLVRDALLARPECESLAGSLTTLLDAHREAMEKVMQEADELKAARAVLETARGRADTLRKAGWHYLSYLSLVSETEIDVRAIYPVAARAKGVDASTADATLDEVGAPTPEPVDGLPPEPDPLGDEPGSVAM